MREMKDSGIEWVGLLPKNWSIKRNKTIFYEVNERCEDGLAYTLLSVSEYTGVSPRSSIIEDGAYETNAESLDGYKICKVGDIVMNIMLAWKRATAVSHYDGIVSPAYCVYRGKDICTDYYHYLFRTDLCADTFKRFSTGIIDSRLRLYPDVFLSLNSIVPPLLEQHRIADYLDRKCAEIDAVIADTQKTIEEYKALKQSIITEAVTKGIRGPRPMKDSGIEWIGEIPVDWDIKKTRFIATNFFKGNGITKEDIDEDGDTYCVRYGEIYSSYDTSFTACLTRTNIERVSSPQFFENGDILFTCTGELVEEIGKNIVYLGHDKCLAGGDIIVMRHTQDPLFLSYALNSAYAQGQKSCGKAKLKVVHISRSQIGNVLVALPPINEQKEIGEYLSKKCSAIDGMMVTKRNLIIELESYKKSLIYEYVTGKKEVPVCP